MSVSVKIPEYSKIVLDDAKKNSFASFLVLMIITQFKQGTSHLKTNL